MSRRARTQAAELLLSDEDRRLLELARQDRAREEARQLPDVSDLQVSFIPDPASVVSRRNEREAARVAEVKDTAARRNEREAARVAEVEETVGRRNEREAARVAEVEETVARRNEREAFKRGLLPAATVEAGPAQFEPDPVQELIDQLEAGAQPRPVKSAAGTRTRRRDVPRAGSFPRDSEI